MIPRAKSVRTTAMANRTDLDDAITRLQAALEDARGMPGWGVGLVVIVSLLCFIILLHVVAVLTVGPCLYALWRRRKQLESDRLLSDEILGDDGNMEMASVAEVADGVVNQKESRPT